MGLKMTASTADLTCTLVHIKHGRSQYCLWSFFGLCDVDAVTWHGFIGPSLGISYTIAPDYMHAFGHLTKQDYYYLHNFVMRMLWCKHGCTCINM